MRATDEHGLAAYECTADATAMAEAGGDVLTCPTCGHRTDTPGEGLLGDGFDVRHRQWGLRGDPHVWASLRDSVADVPTPESPEEIRRTYVEALRDVARIDLDTDGDTPVGRGEFAHGGMSSGMVDVGWWRAKGLPLLVARAGDRRPAPASTEAPVGSTGSSAPARLPGGLLVGLVVWVVFLAIPAMTVGGGSFLLYQRAVGTRTEATVLACETTGAWRRYGSTLDTECAAEWTVDGRRVVGGYAAGEGVSEVGETVDVTVRGETAYSRSLVMPIVLIVLGLPFLYLAVVGVGHAIRRRIRGPDQAPPVSDQPG